MRDYNRRHPHRTVHFMGDDIGAPSINDAFFARVTGYVQRTHPESLPRLNDLYAGLRPIDDVFAYFRKPIAERQRLADKAQQALKLITSLKDTEARPGASAGTRPGSGSGVQSESGSGSEPRTGSGDRHPD